MGTGAYVVALTGGIGSGKSTVAALFESHGSAIVDTDALAHSLTRAGGEAMEPLREAFGDRLVAPDGALDRAAMRELVFSDAAEKARLEAILHPMIRDAADHALASAAVAAAPYAMLVVPLLFEKMKFHPAVARTLAVDCTGEDQIARVMPRSSLAREAVQAIIASQVSRATRLQLADDIIVNHGEASALAPQVAALDHRYRRMAAARSLADASARADHARRDGL